MSDDWDESADNVNGNSNDASGFSNQNVGFSGHGAGKSLFSNDNDRGSFGRRGGRGRGREYGSTDRSYGDNFGGNDSSRKDTRTCRKCNEEGHIARFCPNSQDNNGNSGGGDYSSRKESRSCRKCNEEGHIARDCPESQGRDNENSNGFPKKRSNACFKCQEEGHIAANCDKPAVERRDENGEVKPGPVTYVPDELGDDQLFNYGVSAGTNFSAYDIVPVKVSASGEYPPKVNSFEEANLRRLLQDNVAKSGYRNPMPIQKHSMPVIMAGRDLMACAQTGSGKTAAFLLPILHYIIENNISCVSFEEAVKPTALILTPTRELTIQIFNEARKFAYGSIVKTCISYGGTSVSHQHNKLQNGVHVLVATCGRLLDFVKRGKITFDALKFLVLDEADRMLDMGFKPDIEKIVEHPSMPKKEDRQTLMFSATFATSVQQLAKIYLNDYVFIVTGSVGAANVDVRQTILNMVREDKRDSLLKFMKDELATNENQKMIVFVETKRMADFLAIYLSDNQMNSTSIHGDRHQHQREEALNEFKAGKRNILVATAVAARGLDIQGVGIVINYDMPKDIDEYVHRIGRTGRVGNPGRAVSYFEIANDSHLAKDLVKLLGEAEQEVPDWLISCGETGGGEASYGGKSDFGARDIRRNGIRTEEYPAAAVVGGPMQTNNCPNDEESWD